MKNTLSYIMMGGFVLSTSFAEASIETEIHAGYHSIYEFRGVDFGDDLYEAGVDFSTKLGGGFTLSGGLWYADSDGGNFDELDAYVGLARDFGGFELSVGYTYYAFPGDSGSNTKEVSLGISTETKCGLGLSLNYFKDIDEIDGVYLEFEVSKGFTVNPCWKLNISAGAAWSFDYNSDVDGTSLDGFNHWFVKVAAPYEFAEGFTLTPYVKFVAASSDLDNEFGAVDSKDLFLGGVTLSYSF